MAAGTVQKRAPHRAARAGNHRAGATQPLRSIALPPASSTPAPRRALARLFAALTVLVLASAASICGAASARVPRPAAHSASSFKTGIGDEHPEMFSNPLWTQLHTQIARYIAPYDAAVRPYSLQLASNWIRAAEARHQKILIAFYHSEYTPTRLPSVATYQADVRKFVRLFPHVSEYQSWDESNRGNIPGALESPSASLAARYYQALIRSCSYCTVSGLDVLDAREIGPTLTYISEFKHEIGRLETIMPRVWGLHNYSDVNRLESWRTRELVRALGGEVWLTETGGIVKLDPDFPNSGGEGLRRAAAVLKFVFAVAGSHPQIKRLYIFDWTGGTASTRFDAGLMDARYRPRPGYVVVCRALRAAHCNVRTSDH
jgi:hypothetical protein